jgi:hypothetical protein
MGTYSNALIKVEEIVTRFLFKYKKPLEDATLYVEHVCNAVRDFSLYDGTMVTSTKLTFDVTKRWLDMPDDMQVFVDLVTPLNGSYWSFTKQDRIVTTTTTTGGVEGRDDAQGEGHTIDQPRVTTYGAKGGWNKFRYTIDWASRRIYIDEDLTGEHIVLIYVSSGIKTSGDTTVPEFLTPMLDDYLLWKETYWLPGLARERQMREADYWKEKMKVRNLVNAMSVEEWKDIFYGSFTQTPQR